MTLRTNKKILITTGALLAIGALAFTGSAVARPHGGGFMPMMHLLHKLDLTEQQEVKAVRLRRSVQEEAKSARADVKQTLGGVIPELEKQNPDARKLHGALDQVIEKMGKVAHSTIDKYLELHATLTPEQRKLLVEHAREMQQRSDDHFGKDGKDGKKEGRRWD